ncbi:MAG: hypothetical protein LBJ57_03185 [Prevotellaceae bacterium]|jgi:hypothetical protein|nr:hypothetical protein [Prevotellaceae bacterium]
MNTEQQPAPAGDDNDDVGAGLKPALTPLPPLPSLSSWAGLKPAPTPFETLTFFYRAIVKIYLPKMKKISANVASYANIY